MESLKPRSVIAGHKRVGNDDGPRIIGETRQYTRFRAPRHPSNGATSCLTGWRSKQLNQTPASRNQQRTAENVRISIQNSASVYRRWSDDWSSRM